MAQNFKVIMTSLALLSLKTIYEHIEYCSGDVYYADRFSQNTVNFIDNTFPYNPFIERISDDEYLQRKMIRRITTPDGQYNIYYRVDEKAQTVYIPNIADGKQSTNRQLFGL